MPHSGTAAKLVSCRLYAHLQHGGPHLLVACWLMLIYASLMLSGQREFNWAKQASLGIVGDQRRRSGSGSLRFPPQIFLVCVRNFGLRDAVFWRQPGQANSLSQLRSWPFATDLAAAAFVSLRDGGHCNHLACLPPAAANVGWPDADVD